MSALCNLRATYCSLEENIATSDKENIIYQLRRMLWNSNSHDLIKHLHPRPNNYHTNSSGNGLTHENRHTTFTGMNVHKHLNSVVNIVDFKPINSLDGIMVGS